MFCSVKSGERRWHADIVDVAVVVGDHLGDLRQTAGSLTFCTNNRAGKRCGEDSSTSQRTSTQRSGSSSKSFSAGDWIG